LGAVAVPYILLGVEYWRLILHFFPQAKTFYALVLDKASKEMRKFHGTDEVTT
jgi:hypothetical protein